MKLKIRSMVHYTSSAGNFESTLGWYASNGDRYFVEGQQELELHSPTWFASQEEAEQAIKVMGFEVGEIIHHPAAMPEAKPA